MFCPEWLFGCSAAYTAKGFLSSESSLNGIARKFSKGLSEKYNEINFEDTTKIVDSYIDGVDTDLDKDIIKVQMRELMTEAQALEIA